MFRSLQCSDGLDGQSRILLGFVGVFPSIRYRFCMCHVHRVYENLVNYCILGARTLVFLEFGNLR